MEKFHTPWELVMDMPWGVVVLMLMDTPHIDYSTKKDVREKKATTAEEEIAYLSQFQ